jgi:hypothetical protein
MGDTQMKRLALALGALMLALTSVVPSASAFWQPEWVVIQWTNGDCKIWHNDINAPLGGGWRALAFSRTYSGAWGRLGWLQSRRVCNL